MNNYRFLIKLAKLAALPLLAISLVACDSSVGTSSNQQVNTSANGYNGPPAQNSDTRSFQLHFWEFLKEDNRCGQCHGNGQAPEFVDTSNINTAYAQALPYADFTNPGSSIFVTEVRGGHNCWLADLNACGDSIEQMITNWANNSSVTSQKIIQLTAPPNKDPGATKSFPADPNTVGTNGTSFANTVHPILIGTAAGTATAPEPGNCQRCHIEINPALSQQPQAPFFASNDLTLAYDSARSKMNINTPANSRFVERLLEGHNFWSSNQVADAGVMQAAIQSFADGIPLNPIDPNLLTSKALNLSTTDGIIASGGNRHEINQIATWEFKTGLGGTAFDTSGIDPAADLTLLGNFTWMTNFGLEFNNPVGPANGRAQAIDSSKIHSYIQASGEYTIEAWVVPANVTQTMANIVGYSGGDAIRNFTLGQNLYNYDFYNRIDSVAPGALNGEPFLSSGENGDEFAQATLQHVVLNYDPVNGRSIYVNGVLVNVADPVPGQTTINGVWDSSFAMVLGNEIAGGNRPWNGQVRMVAIHNRVLTQQQIQQNFDVGVGQKFFLLFGIGHHVGVHPQSYILMEVEQFDNYSYLFKTPTFVNLDSAWTPTSAITIKGMRIAVNGKEASAGQAYANLDVVVDSGSYDPALGQTLATHGTVIALDQGPPFDEFFLTFEDIAGTTNPFVEAAPSIPGDPTDPANPVESDIGVHTFQEINETIAVITGVQTTNAAIDSLYDDYIQQLPTNENIDGFLSSHQMAIAQIALTSCSELVENRGSIPRATYFPGFNFGAGAQTAFDTPAKRAQIIDPMLTAAINADQVVPTNNLTSQPAETEVHNMLGSTTPQTLEAGGSNYDSLITELVAANPANTTARTAQIVKAVCAAATGGAVMLVQ